VASKKTNYQPPEKWATFHAADVIGDELEVSDTVQNEFGFLQTDLVGQDQLYYAGELELLRRPCVSVVGSRGVSDAGMARARRLSRELVEAGVVVVSGLAKGVDVNAHSAAIGANGRTVAVIGTPLDTAYPAAHKRLQEEIYRDHLLVSPFKHGQRTYPSSFPQRNRIMVMLSSVSVIVEAGETSGTLHQAKACVEQGRWLFFMKSMLDNSPKWANAFLDSYERARVLTKTQDVLEAISGN